MRPGRLAQLVCLLGVLVAASACDRAPATPDVAQSGPVVSTTDVHHFVAALHRLTPGDSVCAPFGEYLRSGTPGLAAYSHKFGVGQSELCAAVRKHPERYARLDTTLASFDSAGAAIRTIFARFETLQPGAVLPRVYVIVGNGISGGTTTRGRSPIILIGAELTRSAAGLPWTVAHELAHTQQHYPMWRMATVGPSWFRASLLRQSLHEGIADVVAEALTGEPVYNVYGEAHEHALWGEFQRVMYRGDYHGWLYNGREPRPDGRPPDLGYWIGYRIAKAYYDRAPDKARAIRDMLEIRDFDAFLAASGYHGGAS